MAKRRHDTAAKAKTGGERPPPAPPAFGRDAVLALARLLARQAAAEQDSASTAD